jgi:hypothetical protein
MAIVVVGGSGRGAGKTALICGLIRALNEALWTAVKITSHAHGHAEPIYEESTPGQETDTGRYLDAGACRALLVTAHEDALGNVVQRIVSQHSAGGNVIFESNTVLHYLRPDLCLAVATDLRGGHKPSFEIVERCMDATVTLAGHDHVIQGARIHFHLKSLERISAPMREWVRERLASRPVPRGLDT